MDEDYTHSSPILDAAFGRQTAFYHRYMHERIAHLLEQTPRTSLMAYHVFHVLENDGLIGFEDLSKNISEARRGYKHKLRAHKRELQGISAQQEGVMQELEALKAQVNRKRKKQFNKTEKQQMEDIKKRMRRLTRQAKGTRRPSSPKKRYPYAESVEAAKIVPKRDWDHAASWLERTIGKAADVPEPIVYKNLTALCDELNLPPVQRKVMSFLLCYGQSDDLQQMLVSLTDNNKNGMVELAAKMLQEPPEDVAPLLEDGTPLQDMGLVDVGTSFGNGREHYAYPVLHDGVIKAISGREKTGLEMIDGLVGPRVVEKPELSATTAYFKAEGRGFKPWLKSKPKETEPAGSNILLYGAVGSGEDHMIAAVCAEAGFNLFEVDATDKSPWGGHESAPEWARVQKLFQHRPKTAIFMRGLDRESDAVSSRASHQALMRALDRPTVPTFWTAEKPGEMHTGMLEAMDVMVRMKTPSPKQRVDIWRRLSDAHAVALSEGDISYLAHHFNEKVSPIWMVRAATHAGAMQTGRSGIEDNLQTMARAAFGTATAIETGAPHCPSNYDVSLFNACIEGSHDSMQTITDDFIRGKGTKQHILLYGPPGLGKSVYCVWLAQQMGLPVLYKKLSQVGDSHYFTTEKNIDLAFQEAREQGAFLIIDEIDSLASQRGQGGQNDDFTNNITSQLLQEMPNHPLPMACTTNLLTSLDPAAISRFTPVLKCTHMTQHQRRKAYRTVFGEDAPSALDHAGQVSLRDMTDLERVLRAKVHRPDGLDIVRRLKATADLARKKGSFIVEGFHRRAESDPEVQRFSPPLRPAASAGRPRPR